MSQNSHDELSRFFSYAKASADDKRYAVQICVRAGFERVEHFENADMTSVEGFEQLPPYLKEAFRRLPQLAAKRRRVPSVAQHSNAEDAAKRARLTLPSEACVAARGVGPTKAAATLASSLRNEAEAKAWLETARLQAVLGSAPRSVPSIRSGLRCWAAFVDAVAQARPV